jgi:hypothetical protein
VWSDFGSIPVRWTIQRHWRSTENADFVRTNDVLKFVTIRVGRAKLLAGSRPIFHFFEL